MIYGELPAETDGGGGVWTASITELKSILKETLPRASNSESKGTMILATCPFQFQIHSVTFHNFSMYKQWQMRRRERIQRKNIGSENDTQWTSSKI